MAARGRSRPGRVEAALLAVAALTLVHLVDQVLRADAGGWPFAPDLTWFSASLLVYPALLAGLLVLRGRPWAWVALGALLLGAVQVPHMFWETPADQYGTWAHGVSWMAASPGRPNLLGISSPARATRWCPRPTSTAMATTRQSARSRSPNRSCRPWSGSPYHYDHWLDLLSGLARRL